MLLRHAVNFPEVLGLVSFHFILGCEDEGIRIPLNRDNTYFQRRAPMSLLHIFSQPLSLAIAVEDLKGKSPLLKSFFWQWHESAPCGG